MGTDIGGYRLGGGGDTGSFTPIPCIRCKYRRKRPPNREGHGTREDYCTWHGAPCRRVYGYCQERRGGRGGAGKVGSVNGAGPVLGP
ncbi:MAG: hypothetical protein HFG22_01810 [Lachnospiraceae bacterium]|nr:hypothetical protein [Lachnospiraceae bacterium]